MCVVSLLGANAEIKFTIPVGRIFTYELMRETFQNDFEPLSKLYGNGSGAPPSSQRAGNSVHISALLCV